MIVPALRFDLITCSVNPVRRPDEAISAGHLMHQLRKTCALVIGCRTPTVAHSTDRARQRPLRALAAGVLALLLVARPISPAL